MTDFLLPGGPITPAEGEHTVRTYYATTLSSRILGLKADGYLTVTNMRVIFYASGSSRSGRSILQSEVPISDVSGISCYKGSYFSFKHLFSAIGLSWILSFLTSSILFTITAALFSFIIRNQSLQEPGSLGNGLGSLQTIFWIIALILIGVSFRLDRSKIWRSAIAAAGTFVIISISGLNTLSGFVQNPGRQTDNGVFSMLASIPFLMAVIYVLWCYFWYARRETMSIAVGSKGGASTPIAIAGISSFGLYNTAAFQALTAEPTLQAEKMIRELGALITDVQLLGGHAMTKWSSQLSVHTPPKPVGE